jgi:hypothetical protein
MQGGFVLALQRIYPDHMKANALAKDFVPHPAAIPWPSLLCRPHCFRGWRREVIKSCLKEDTGDRPIPPEVVTVVARSFHIVAGDMSTRRTWTKSYFRQAINWYRVLLLTPLLLIITTVLTNPSYRASMLCVTLFATVVMLTATGLAVDNSIRYLHPLGWTFFVFAAYWVNTLLRHVRASRQWLRSPGSALLGCLLFGLLMSAKVADASDDPPGLYVRDFSPDATGTPYLESGPTITRFFGQLLQNKDDTTCLDKLARLGGRYSVCSFPSKRNRT